MTKKRKEAEIPDKPEDPLDDKQRKHDYYYDDAHGYQNYTPDEDDDDDEKKSQTVKNDPA